MKIGLVASSPSLLLSLSSSSFLCWFGFGVQEYMNFGFWFLRQQQFSVWDRQGQGHSDIPCNSRQGQVGV